MELGRRARHRLLDINDQLDKISFRKGWKRNAVTTEITRSHNRRAFMLFPSGEACAALRDGIACFGVGAVREGA